MRRIEASDLLFLLGTVLVLAVLWSLDWRLAAGVFGLGLMLGAYGIDQSAKEKRTKR